MPHASANTLVSPSAAPVLPSGSVIGQKYRIDAVLVEGGMGIVYKGFHVGLEKPVAIKVVRAEYAQQPEAVARFLNEARAAAQLRGIHVAHVLDTGRIEGAGPYLVMEYLEGCDLRVLLQENQRLPVELAVNYVLQACEAVAEAHAAGIVHRDLKPENLFLARMPDGSELIKVIDFGISKRLGASERSFTMAGQTLGSPHYMAPEQMRHPEQVEPPADIWSLGVVLYELLAGQTPFEGDSLPAVCLRVCGERAQPPSALGIALPPALEHVVMRCLEKEPGARFQNVHELIDALTPFGGPTQNSAVRRIDHLGIVSPRSISSQRAALSRRPPGSTLSSPRFTPSRRLEHDRVEQDRTTGIRTAWDTVPPFRRRSPAAKVAAVVAGLAAFALAPMLYDSAKSSEVSWAAQGTELISGVKQAVSSALSSTPKTQINASITTTLPRDGADLGALAQEAQEDGNSPKVTVSPVNPEPAPAARRSSRTRPARSQFTLKAPREEREEKPLSPVLPKLDEKSLRSLAPPPPRSFSSTSNDSLDQLMDPYSSSGRSRGTR